MTKKWASLFYVLVCLFSLSVQAETNYILKTDVESWNKSIINRDFYKKVITNENCKATLQKFVGCVQSVRLLLERVLNDETIEIVDQIPTLTARGSDGVLISEPKSEVRIKNAELIQRYDIVKTIIESGALTFVEAKAKASTMAENQEIKSDRISRITQRAREVFKRMYTEVLKSPTTSFEVIIEFIFAQKAHPAINPILVSALNEYLTNAVDPHTKLTLEKKYLKYLGKGQFENDSFGFSYGYDSSHKNLKITEVLLNSPAERAGINRGDRILQINGADVQSKTILEKSDVKNAVLLVQSGEATPRTVEIEKAKFKTDNVESGDFEFGSKVYGYAKLRVFSGLRNAKRVPMDCLALANIFAEFQKSTNGAILDLRGNPGGLTESAVCIAGLLLGPGQIVYYDQTLATNYFSDGLMKLFTNPGKNDQSLLAVKTLPGIPKVNNKPLVILVDQGSASAAELLAAALRDHNRAFIVGTVTFGKGTMGVVSAYNSLEHDLKVEPNNKEEFSYIPDERVTIVATFARFFSPIGLSHHATGMTPHLVKYKELEPSAEEIVTTKESDIFMFPITNTTLQSLDKKLTEKMNKLVGDHDCIKSANLPGLFNMLPDASLLKDMQILTGMQQLECELARPAK